MHRTDGVEIGRVRYISGREVCSRVMVRRRPVIAGSTWADHVTRSTDHWGASDSRH